MGEKFDLEKYRSIGVVGVRTVDGQFQRDIEKKNERELEAYRAVRKEGIQPDGTYHKQMDAAKKASDLHGVAYDGNDRTAMAQKAGLVSEVTPIRKGEE